MEKIISVIVPLYKGKKYIARIIDMVEKNAQTLLLHNYDHAVDLIFVNDYPADIIECIPDSKVIDIRYIPLKRNKGIHSARVEGLKKAKGEYILFLDQDDEISVEWMYSQLCRIGEASLIVCNGIYRNNRKIYGSHEIQKVSISKNDIRNHKIISPGQVLIRKNKIPKIWMTDLLKKNGSDDYYLWILMFSAGERAQCNDEILYKHNEEGENQSFHWREMLDGKYEVLHHLEKNKKISKDIINQVKDFVSVTKIKFHPYILFDRIVRNNKKIFFSQRVSIYGMGVYGKKLLTILRQNHINVLFGVDKDARAMMDSSIKIYLPDESLPDVDLMIVTAEFVFSDIEKKYHGKMNVMRMSEFLQRYVKKS